MGSNPTLSAIVLPILRPVQPECGLKQQAMTACAGSAKDNTGDARTGIQC